MYPEIRCFADIEPHIAGRPDIRVIEHTVLNRPVLTLCYMIEDVDTFDCAWRKECRGIVFDKASGALLARGFHKFKNVGEAEETQPNVLRQVGIRRVTEKRDGSMIIPVLIGDALVCKTKKSFESDPARKARALIQTHTDNGRPGLEYLCRDLLAQGQTPLLEYTDPDRDCRIVITYPEAALELLTVRDNLTGRYWTQAELTALAEQYHVPLVDSWAHQDLNTLIQYVRALQQREGCVIEFENGTWAKLKSEWYSLLHHTLTHYRERDVARLCLSEAIDDIKPLISDPQVRAEIEAVETRFRQCFHAFVREFEQLADLIRPMEKRAAWEQYGQHFAFKQATHLLRGNTPNYVDLYTRHRLKHEFSLAKLHELPHVPTVAECQDAG